jgi:hypothetical protein
VLEAACLLTAGLENLDQAYEPQALELATRRFRGGIGLQELLLEAAWANGYTGRNFRDSRAVLRAAFGRGIEAGFSTIDVGGILSNVANKFLLEGFFSVERVWRNICAVRNVSDFKTVSSYRLVGKDQYELVSPAGELKHGTLGEEKYTNKADTYGLVLTIDRRDIINDDLGAITTVPRKLGRGSGLKINDVFWTVFLNNASFFTAGTKSSCPRRCRPSARSCSSRSNYATRPRPRSSRWPIPTRANSASRSAATWPTASTRATRPRRGTCSPIPMTCR